MYLYKTKRHLLDTDDVFMHSAATHLSGRFLLELAPYMIVGCRSVIGPVPLLLLMNLDVSLLYCLNYILCTIQYIILYNT